jgi:HSP20 family protein
MDKDTKNFFEKLAGINSKDEKVEFELEPKSISKQDTEEGPLVEEPSLEEIFEEAEGELAVDVYQTASAFIIESTIAGVNPEDIDVSLTPESITIKGKREKEERIKTENYIHQECYWGRFSRTIILPQEIDPDKVQASIKNGVLKITLPKLNKSKIKKIKVKFE